MQKQKIMLGLQGGGTLGAFTSGVLDTLFEANLFDIAGISGTSAGALNAILTTDGLIKDGPKGAQKMLRIGWENFPALVPGGKFVSDSPFLSQALQPFHMLRSTFTSGSFYSALPDFLQREINIEAVRTSESPRLVVNATDMQSGQEKIFAGSDLSVQAIAASCGIQPFMPAIEIAGRTYCDGGYVSNPPLRALIERCPDSSDLLIILLMPTRADKAQISAQDKVARGMKILQNAAVMKEIEHIEHINGLLQANRLRASETERPINIHMIEIDLADGENGLGTMFSLSTRTVNDLADRGRKAGAKWLAQHGGKVGRESSFKLESLRI